MRDPEQLRTTIEQLLSLPLHHHLGLRLVDADDPAAGVEMTVGPQTANPFGVLHGGIVPLVIDVTGFLALLPMLPGDRHAVTVSTTSSIIAVAHTGDVVRCTAQVERVGRRQAFLSGRLTVGDRVVATGQVVKAVVPA